MQCTGLLLSSLQRHRNKSNRFRNKFRSNVHEELEDAMKKKRVAKGGAREGRGGRALFPLIV